MWIVEDNVSCHLATRRMTERIRQEKGVEYAPHPANSPDLNEIEPFWGDVKGIMAPPDPGLSGAMALNVCQEEVSYIFSHLDQSIVDKRCQHFKASLIKCLQHMGDNIYHG